MPYPAASASAQYPPESWQTAANKSPQSPPKTQPECPAAPPPLPPPPPTAPPPTTAPQKPAAIPPPPPPSQQPAPARLEIGDWRLEIVSQNYPLKETSFP